MSNILATSSMIADHGALAVRTAGGLLALPRTVGSAPAIQAIDDVASFFSGDATFFEHDANGDVHVPTVRRWLGY